MAYKKKYVPRKKSYRRRRVYRRSSTKAPSTARLALRLLETKKKESFWNETSLSSLASWFTNADAMKLTQNDSYSGLEGHIVRGKGISYTGWFKNNGTTTMLVRFGVICVKQGRAQFTTFASGSDAFEGDTINFNVTTATSAQRITQRFNQDQYRVIKNYVIKLGANNATDGSDVRQFKIWIPLQGHPFRYDGGDGVLPTRNVYSFFAMNVLGNNDESLGENVETNGYSCFYYVDP